MWSKNYSTYLVGNIDFNSVSSMDACDKSLENVFTPFIIGSISFNEIKKIFIKIKNTAISEFIKKSEKIDIEEVLKKAESIGLKKNNDYGSDNILKYGIIGIIVRIGDKIARYQNLIKDSSKQMVMDEKIEDTLMDIVNYATYGEMLSDGVWS
ncbi:MAG: hypothetical protein ACP5UN_03850 [Candidatus Micrarchaeia archaeon]